MKWYGMLDTPLGPLRVEQSELGLTAVHLPPHRARSEELVRDDERCAVAMQQLSEYFAGTRTCFELPLAAEGTPFQRRVWSALGEIPLGDTWSYGQLAARLGDPKQARAVGAANGQNPIAIIVPCHRVIGADGTLTGYAGGLENKRWLLDHEAKVAGLESRPDRFARRPKSSPDQLRFPLS